MRSPLPAKQSLQTKAAVVLMPGSGAQMFDRLPGRGAKPGLSPDTERLPRAEEGGKIAFHGFRQIIEFKSPVYNSSWSWRILSIYLRSHFPFFLGWQWQITISLPDFYSAQSPSLTMAVVKYSKAGQAWFTQFSAVRRQNRTSINKWEPWRKATELLCVEREDVSVAWVHTSES